MARVNHLAIIVDGNGRWAQERNLPRSEGHTAGAKNLEKLIMYITKNNIANYLSLYVFSTENFKRSEEEVNHLMDLFMYWFDIVKTKYQKENIKILFSGTKDGLKEEIKDAMNALEENTKDNTGLVVNFCMGYGGRREIVDATKKICNEVLGNNISVDQITEESFAKYLYKDLPDIDFLIRTSGESRVSNFMLWQISYAEFYFPKEYFPDFDTDNLEQAIKEYEKRDRRFGKIKK